MATYSRTDFVQNGTAYALSNAPTVVTYVVAKSDTVQCIREDTETGTTSISIVVRQEKLYKNWAKVVELVAVPSEGPV